MSPQQVLDQYFLNNRCMLLEIAAMLDRYDRAAKGGNGRAAGDLRLEKIYQSLDILADRRATPDRAERLLRLYSDPAD